MTKIAGKLAIGIPFYIFEKSVLLRYQMEDRNDIDLTNLYEDRWRPCEKCVIRNPSCDDCKSMWTARRWDEENIQRARIHERVEVDLTNEDDTDDERRSGRRWRLKNWLMRTLSWMIPTATTM